MSRRGTPWLGAHAPRAASSRAGGAGAGGGGAGGGGSCSSPARSWASSRARARGARTRPARHPKQPAPGCWKEGPQSPPLWRRSTCRYHAHERRTLSIPGVVHAAERTPRSYVWYLSSALHYYYYCHFSQQRRAAPRARAHRHTTHTHTHISLSMTICRVVCVCVIRCVWPPRPRAARHTCKCTHRSHRTPLTGPTGHTRHTHTVPEHTRAHTYSRYCAPRARVPCVRVCVCLCAHVCVMCVCVCIACVCLCVCVYVCVCRRESAERHRETHNLRIIYYYLRDNYVAFISYTESRRGSV